MSHRWLWLAWPGMWPFLNQTVWPGDRLWKKQEPLINSSVKTGHRLPVEKMVGRKCHHWCSFLLFQGFSKLKRPSSSRSCHLPPHPQTHTHAESCTPTHHQHSVTAFHFNYLLLCSSSSLDSELLEDGTVYFSSWPLCCWAQYLA